MGLVYLLHFDAPYKQARHYIGFSDNLEQRLRDHRGGRGSKLMHAVCKAGITFRVARTWEGDRHLERRLHRRKNSAQLCPICQRPRTTTTRRM